MSEHLLLIGDFSTRSRLPPRALRLYDELGLLVPVHVDPANGYRWYAVDQLHRAQVVALLRRLDMPLARIREVLNLPAPEAAAEVRAYWAEAEHAVAGRAATVEYLSHLLENGAEPMNHNYDVSIRPVADRALLSAIRHVNESDAGSTMGSLLGRMRTAGPGPGGVDGCPFAIYHGEVSADSDGPMEIVRPVIDLETAVAAAAQLGDVQARPEPAHDEAVVCLTLPQARWPAQLEAVSALEAHVRAVGREPAGAPRQV